MIYLTIALLGIAAVLFFIAIKFYGEMCLLYKDSVELKNILTFKLGGIFLVLATIAAIVNIFI